MSGRSPFPNGHSRASHGCRSSRLWWTLAGVASVAAALAAQPSPSRGVTAVRESVGGRHALLIGNSRYRAISPLRNPEHDVEDLAAALSGIGFRTRVVKDADQPTMRSEILGLAERARSASVALLYFAGHGVQIDGSNFLVPVDFAAASEQEARTAAIDAAEVQGRLERVGATLTLMVLDACRNNPWHSGQPRGKGLAPMETRLGTLIAFASASGQVADENAAERNGLFTKHLLASLPEPVAVVDLFRRVRERVHAASRGRQRPYLQEDVIGDFRFASLTESGNLRPPSVPVQLSPPPDSQPQLAEGLRRYRQGDWPGALDVFEQMRRADPENVFAHNGAGVAYQALGQPGRAVECFNQAIRLRPGYAAAYHNRGLAYLQAARYGLAREDFDWALDEVPDDPLLHAHRGQAQFGERRYEDAIRDCTRAIELFPDGAAAHFWRGKSLHRLGRLEEALADLTKAVRLRPGDARSYEARAEVWQALGRDKEAAADRSVAEQQRAKLARP